MIHPISHAATMKVLGLRHPRNAMSSVAPRLEMCGPRLFLVIILLYILHGRVIFRLRLFSAQSRFRNFIDTLVATTDEVLIAHSRNTPASTERESTQSRVFPVTLAWSVAQRASRDINIQAAIEHVTSFLLVNSHSHTVRQSWAKQ